MLESELETAISLAQIAANRILEYYNDTIIIEEKIGADNFAEPVTAADREASLIIVDGLKAAFPLDAVLSEEETDDIEVRLRSERVWIIDPIDGTAGFIKKDGDFAVQIGLSLKGEAVLGVVLLPFHGKVYYASKGNGAWLLTQDSKPTLLKVSANADISEMTVAISKNHPNSSMRTVLDDMAFRKSISRGSVGIKMGLIGERECDVYIHLSPRTKMWDTCGPQIILEEAGGKLTDIYGKRYRYDRTEVQNFGGIAASNGVSHEDIISGLRPILAQIGRPRFSENLRG